MSKRANRILLPIGAAALLVSGCGAGGREDGVKAESDPALASAIADPIMLDTDLAEQNRASAAIAGGGAAVIELPLVERNPETIAAAKAEAARLAGGKLSPAPSPREGGVPAGAAGVAAAQLIGAAKGIAANCTGKAEYGLAWSQRLPEVLSIYPRGHLREAAGADSQGCQLRVVSFVTPVEPGEVIDFYHTRTKAAGFVSEHRLAEGIHYLGASKGAAAYAVHARKLENGLTEVDLVANGG